MSIKKFLPIASIVAVPALLVAQGAGARAEPRGRMPPGTMAYSGDYTGRRFSALNLSTRRW